ncbi:GNAT family N-acetyltransferase [Nocardia barduliensis]|uniref:GNAT family N-acetyltransferase n=1 Tax=Nocardia barduliensis TaxID=2736643 RepID=UPI0015721BC5|nr:GNAT family N-acetyltransferase [Nocardia barduliensis]
MISYAWSERLDDQDREDAAALVTHAAEYDEEAGFTTIDPRAASAVSDAATVVWHLPIKARRDFSMREDAPLELVAYLHLTVDRHGQGIAALVVHPRYRSRGVATALVEELGLDTGAPGGWCGTGAHALRGWAYGSHPASERLTRRFGVLAVARLWTVLRPLTGPFAAPLELPEPRAGVTVTAHEAAEAADRVRAVLGRAELPPSHRDRALSDFSGDIGRVLLATGPRGADLGFAWYDPRLRDHLELRTATVRALVLTSSARGSGLGADLLGRALTELRAGGAQVARMRMDPDDEGALRTVRLLSFEQEDAHACYQVGEWSEPPVYPR